MPKTYSRAGLTGDTTDTLDGIDGAELVDGDRAIVITATDAYLFRLNATSGASQVVPQVISPTINADNKRWELVTVTQQQSIEDVLTLQGLTVENDAKIKNALEVLQKLTVGGELDVSAAATIAGALTVQNDIEATGSINAAGFTVNGTPVGSSTDTFWESDAEGNISYNAGHVFTGPIKLNAHTISANTTVPAGYHGMAVGPLDIDADVTISSNSILEVI